MFLMMQHFFSAAKVRKKNDLCKFHVIFFELWLLAVSCWLNKKLPTHHCGGSPTNYNYFYYEGTKGLGQSFYTPSDRAEGDIPRCQEQHQEPGCVAYRCGIGHRTDRVVLDTRSGPCRTPTRTGQRIIGFGSTGRTNVCRGRAELIGRRGRYIGSGSGGLIYGLIPPVLGLRIGGISVREGCCMTHATHHPKHQYTPYQNITIFHFLNSHFSFHPYLIF